MQDLRHWLALLRAPGLDGSRLAALLDTVGTPQDAFTAAARQLASLSLTPNTRRWLAKPDWARVDADLAWLESSGSRLLIHGQPGYPSLLAELPDAPAVLYVQGDPVCLTQPQLAMVGSRNPSAQGLATARDFASHLARAGLVVTSGLALGIDAASHQGALAGGGVTLAVCGTGLDQIYPASHRALAEQIVAHGALISEYPPGTPPLRENFPRRNRIIAALSLGTLVVEAALRSGSLITARLAGEQGREVFAIPGSIHNPLSKGCHQLIRQGAKLVETAQDILEELGPLAGALAPVGTAESPRATEEEPDPAYATVLNTVGYDPTPVDVIVERTGMTADVVCSMLLILELQGQVAVAPGGRYSRIKERLGA